MRIAIDARELCGRPTGVGRYLSGILQAWDEDPRARQHEYVLCAPEPPQVHDLTRLRLDTLTAPGRGGTLWEQMTLPGLVRRARAEVLFSPGYTAPLLSPVPFVVAIHDVSFAAHPEWFSKREGARRRLVTRAAARRAARVLTISEFSRAEVVRHLGVPPAKVAMFYPGVPAGAAGRGPAGRDLQTILYVGSIFNRRHVPEIIEAFGLLAPRRPGTRLEIVGDNRTFPRIDLAAAAARTGVADRIRVRAYVSDAELRALYSEARAFVFLSEYEGFGLTPLEAIANGVPPVVLDTPVARETCGGAALYVPGPAPAAIADALERALDGPARERLLAAGPAVLARYSWAACAAGVLDVLEEAGRLTGAARR